MKHRGGGLHAGRGVKLICIGLAGLLLYAFKTVLLVAALILILWGICTLP